jgi:GntR family transcriptional regulator/MocR family aminotransferase
MRHPLANPEIPDPDGLIVGFAAPAEHAFAAAVEALCNVLNASGLAS